MCFGPVNNNNCHTIELNYEMMRDDHNINKINPRSHSYKLSPDTNHLPCTNAQATLPKVHFNA